jgi:hypothetical protein
VLLWKFMGEHFPLYGFSCVSIPRIIWQEAD